MHLPVHIKISDLPLLCFCFLFGMLSLFAPFLFFLVGAAIEGGADGGGKLGGGGDKG